MMAWAHGAAAETGDGEGAGALHWGTGKAVSGNAFRRALRLARRAVCGRAGVAGGPRQLASRPNGSGAEERRAAASAPPNDSLELALDDLQGLQSELDVIRRKKERQTRYDEL